MKKIISFVSVIIIFFIILIGIIVYFLFNNGSFLTSFKFSSVNNVGLTYYVYFDKVKAANNYEIVVYDSNNLVIYKENTKKNNSKIVFDKLSYDENYKIVVYAYDKHGNKKSIKDPYYFLWDDLSFDINNQVLMNNDEDYYVYFLGDYNKKDYTINIYENDNLIDSKSIDDEYIVIKNDIFKDKQTELYLEIVEDSLVIDKLKLYNLKSPIDDIKITNPSNGDMKDYNDVAVNFTGGDNATNYILELYQNNNLIRTKEITNKNIILSNNLFSKASKYKLKIVANYMDYSEYSKSTEIEFTINEKETLKPVYTNYNFNLIKYGSEIELVSPDNANIYYTIDGSDPNINSTLYTGKIKITKDTTIKAIAVEDKKNDSVISEFDFKVGSKNIYKVYLSASNQNANLGVEESGYTNEKKEMNDLANYIEKRLEKYGVKVYRNEYGDMNRWIADSNYLNVDLHLAIHSNASEEHKNYGIETWVNEPISKTYSLASKIQNNLFNIYYNKDDVVANRGVKFAYGSLGEVNGNYLPFGILVEVAHHDYLDDAKWIMENKEKIGNNIADSVLEYFQIK